MICRVMSVSSIQANVAAELVVCHVLLGATGAAERLLHRERDEGFTVWLPSGHKVLDDCTLKRWLLIGDGLLQFQQHALCVSRASVLHSALCSRW
jgi:hypothetical protein